MDDQTLGGRQVCLRNITELNPYAHNPRTHSRKQIRQIANSLKRFGWTNPILIDEAGGVIAGHGRFEAAKLLGMTQVPTICLAGLTDAEKRAYIILDNRIAENAGWDRELLAVEFNALVEDHFDLELTGFDTIEIDTLLGSVTGDETEEEDVELPVASKVPVSRVGDLWVSRDAMILCDDARMPGSYERLLGQERAQMCFLDPPYNVAAESISGLGKVKHGPFVMGSGELSRAEFIHDLIRRVFRQLAAFSDPGAIAFICSDWRHLRDFQDAADGVFQEQKNLIVFAKTNAGMGSFYRSQYELILAYKISQGEHINNFSLGEGNRRHRSNLWVYPGANTFRKGRMDDLAVHPSVKPLKLVQDAILDCSKPGGIILDSFLGSGTTVLAAVRAGRRGRGIELDPVYADVCVSRLQKEIGEPVRLETGETFDEVRERRLNSKEY